MKKHFVPICLLLGYAAFLIRIMVFKAVPVIQSGNVTLNYGGTNGGHPANLIPFASIIPYMLGERGVTQAVLNIGGNIALLVPFGFLATFLYRKMNWKKAVLCGVLAGLTVEVLQSVLKVGIFDIDDVILNALGFVIGYVSFIVLIKWKRESKYVHILFAIMLIVLAAAGAFYVIYPHGQSTVVRHVKQ